MNRLNNNQGSVLLLTYFITTLLIGLGAALVLYSINDANMVERQRKLTAAQNTAEAGMERAMYDLRQDCEANPNTFSWSDGDINGMTIGPDSTTYYNITSYSGNSINGGSYSVDLKNVSGESDQIWIKSTGTIGGSSQVIEVYVRAEVVSPWHTAIFGGAGNSTTILDGDFDARGTVHLLGSSLSSSDYAMDYSGAAHTIRNNYQGLDSSLDAKIPNLETIVFNSETVETLEATLRVKNGLVGLSGSGTVGEADDTGNSYKETLYGVYVNDGYGGSQGSSNVYSDNGTAEGYDLGNALSFPSLTDPYPGYTDFQDYLYNNSLVINDPSDLLEMANIKPNSSFNFVDLVNGFGSVSVDGSGNLAVSGRVYVDGGDIRFDKHGSDETINYTGSGVLFTTGAVNIKVNLLSSGSNSFPTNIIGFMATDDIDFDRTDIDVMGLFYANSMHIEKDLDVVGTLVSNYIDNKSTPTVYQVPSTTSNLPSGLIGTAAQCLMKIVSWKKS